MKATAAAMNSRGHRTRAGASWSDTAVSRILRQRSLKEMIPEDLWHQCRARLAERGNGVNRPGRRAVHPLGSVVHCKCGGRMYLRGGASADKFICRECRAKIVPDTLDRVVGEGLAAIELTPEHILEGLLGNPRAAEVSRRLGGCPVTLSEVWPSLGASEKRQLVDLLIARVVVDRAEITVIFAVSADFEAETGDPDDNGLPSSHSLRPSGHTATEQGHVLPAPGGSDRQPSSAPSPRPPVEPKAYRIHHVAELLNLPKSTVYDLVRTGAIASVRMGTGGGGIVLVPASAVAEFLEKKKRRR